MTSETHRYCGDPINHARVGIHADFIGKLRRRRAEHPDMTLDDAMAWLESERERLNEEHRSHIDCPGMP
ncbi:hypothetical protein [Plantactinospora endophytica]|uniref:Uncharacterized protein n=1 Tax=Plantactinospora endophytica TaxID=673535 RepID=A0ABQ4EF50_9ACTN|nr:hypothetical protein [Plantactinospora endophytica]GIG93341.1 hypothetical protein Pen02_82770 [Plantactinospora endophytica]